MAPELSRVFKDCKLRHPLPESRFRDVVQSLKTPLPDDYLSLMLYANGFTGTVGENYINLWPLEEVSLYGRREFNPGLLFFGSDGGGEGFAFDTGMGDMPVVWTPFIGSGPETTVYAACNVTEFLTRLSQVHLFDLPRRTLGSQE